MTVFDIVQLVLRIGLAIALLFMGALHFVPSTAKGMAAMIPPSLRGSGALSPRRLVQFTGLCEFAGAVGLLFPPLAFAAGLCLVAFFIAVFPANVYAAEHRDRFGAVAIPFWPRYLGQLALIALVLIAVVPA
jgi:uncharacterized membrane protein